MKASINKKNIPGCRTAWLVIIIFIFIGFIPRLWGQSYLVHKYSEAQGLPSAVVSGLTQDYLGRMWFATRLGVSCYDGVSFVNYISELNSPSLTYSKIAIDRQGHIWALSNPVLNNLHIKIFRDNRWISLVSPEGIMNISNVTGFELVNHNGRTRALIGASNDGLISCEAGKWTRLSTADGLLSDEVNGIALWEDRCFIATAEGLSILQPNGTIDNSLNEKLNLPAGGIKSIVIEYAGLYPNARVPGTRIWLYGDGWLGNFSPGNPKLEYAQVKIRFAKRQRITPIKMIPDYRRGLYIGNRYEIFYFDCRTGRLTSLGMKNGLIGEGCHSLFIDFEKNVWIAGEWGLSKLVSRRFENYQLTDGLLDDEVSAVLEYEPGKYVLGHNPGLTYWENGKFTHLPFGDLRGRASLIYRVLELKADALGNTWIAASGAGLARVDRHKKITWFGEEWTKSGYMFNSIAIDKWGNFWVGATSGLFLKKKDRINMVLPQTSIRRLYVRRDGSLALGTMDSGMLLSQGSQWKRIIFPDNNKVNSIYSIKEDSHGRLLVGTLAGLYMVEQESLKKFVEGGFSLDWSVYFIQEDRRGRLWLGTENGIVRWDGSRTVHYSTSDGLIGQEVNRGTGIIDSQGRLCIGTNRGFSIYDERFDDVDEVIPPPRLNLMYLEVNDRKVSFNDPLTFDHNTQSLAFHFRGISFYDEKAVRFQHKLEGFDRQWSGEQYPYNQVLRYANIPAGKYRFYLRARNARGIWSKTISTSTLVIRGPFYRKWWFLSPAFLLVALLGYVVFRFFTQQRYAALLEKQVVERTTRLREIESRYRNLFEESLDAVFISTPAGLILDMNPAGLALFGFQSKEEALDTYVISTYYNPADRAALIQALEQHGYLKNYEVALRNKKGDKIIVQITATLVRDRQGQIIAYRGIIRDITDKKRLEQQLLQSQKMEAIGTLAGGIAHDFNNILGVITGYTELLLDDLPKGDTRSNVEHIELAAHRAAGLVKQILTFSRRDIQERKPISLTRAVQDALKLLRASLPATIEIRQNLNAGSDMILADITQINQVIMNLGANAAYAMRGKTGIFEINLDEIFLDDDAVKNYNDLKPGPYLRLSVHDTGRGIPQEAMKHIFEPYFTTKKMGEGSGMGLAVIHGIVKTHRGDITAYSEPGSGATFKIYFPRVEIDGDKGETPQQQEDLPTGTERILLVDDEKDLTLVGSRILQRLGYTVEAKTEPKEALELFKQNPRNFQLVITDLTMPQMTGIQLGRKIKRIDPGMPMILCSGFGDTLSRERSRGLGFNDFIVKPIVKSELARLVRRVLDENSSRGTSG